MGAGEILATGVISIAVLIFDCLTGRFHGYPFHSSKEAAVRDGAIDTYRQLRVDDMEVRPIRLPGVDLWEMVESCIPKYLRSIFVAMLLVWIMALSIISWNMGHMNYAAIDQIDHRTDALNDKAVVLDDRINLLIENVVDHDMDLINVNKHQGETNEIAAFILDMNHRLCLERFERTDGRSDLRSCPEVPSKIKLLAAQAERARSGRFDH